MPRQVVWPVLVAVAAATPPAAAQDRPELSSPDSVQLIPGPHYRAGWLHRRFLGEHYRDLWVRPLAVAVLDLDRVGGGLVPECRVPGSSTPAVRLRGADGRRYVFQAVDRDPADAGLPAALRRTPAADLLRDQASSRHPAGALVVAPLLAAVGVPHPEPQLRVMPDHPALGEFRQFAGVLGLLEARAETPSAGTAEVWTRVAASPRDRVDARAYLAARLIDLVVGDGDRRFERWEWLADSVASIRIWRPMPRDRDQAFARMDGIVPSVARLYWPQLVTFTASYPRMVGLTWSARALDRRFLVALDRPVWDSLAGATQTALADSVLDGAVRRLPPELYAQHGPALFAALQRRRDRLPQAVDAFYDLVARFADVHATEEDDVAEIDRVDAGHVRVRLAPAVTPDAEYFRRTFRLDETVELRIYLGAGDDRIVVRGRVPRSIIVRVVGGAGNDVLADSSLVGLPVVRSVLTRTMFYDAEGRNAFARAAGTEVHEREFRPPRRRAAARPPPSGACADSPAVAPPRELADPFTDWGARWVVTPWASVQPNLGVLVGAAAARHGYAFRRAPYGSRIALRGAFATGPGRFRLWYEGDFRNLPRGAWASTTVRYSGIDLVRFHGFGNQTAVTRPAEFYRVTQRQVSAALAVTAFPPRGRVSVGPFFGFAGTELGRGNLIDSLRPYGAGDFAEAGLEARVDVDTRDRAHAPRRGVHLAAAGRLVPGMLDVREGYGSAAGAASLYLGLGDPARVTIAVRAGGARVWGTFPFHAAAYLGGATSLRGYVEQRFAGEAALFGNAETRLFVARLSLVVPSEVGVLALADVGRVYEDGERSDRWHGAAGGGVWVAFLERDGAVTLTAARSPEGVAVYGGLGFMF